MPMCEEGFVAKVVYEEDFEGAEIFVKEFLLKESFSHSKMMTERRIRVVLERIRKRGTKYLVKCVLYEAVKLNDKVFIGDEIKQ